MDCFRISYNKKLILILSYLCVIKKKMHVQAFYNAHQLAVKAHNQAVANLRTNIDQENEESPFLAQSRHLATETAKALKKASDRIQWVLLLQCYNDKMQTLIQ
jgi:hypothetical protein